MEIITVQTRLFEKMLPVSYLLPPVSYLYPERKYLYPYDINLIY